MVPRRGIGRQGKLPKSGDLKWISAGEGGQAEG